MGACTFLSAATNRVMNISSQQITGRIEIVRNAIANLVKEAYRAFGLAFERHAAVGHEQQTLEKREQLGRGLCNKKNIFFLASS